ncbi:hypothetical protein NP233_g10630 [Leucocoprinus birnbaumii]|uniref:Uncharacterized protein n=1 Tax=Leucocoprinus birnbaumii TaxID=56174 RepID=A0AAD5YPN4_9AGAR|nr:hypothetical protein NP233_g10630 [Leucocoprinus birnbaumii]
MRSFTLLAAVTALFVSAITFALPHVGSGAAITPVWRALPGATSGNTGVSSGDNPFGDYGTSTSGGVSGHNGGGAKPGIGDILAGLNGKIDPLSRDLTNKLSGGVTAQAAVEVSIEVLAQIKGLLVAAAVDIQAGVGLTLNGQGIDSHGLAGLLATLIIIIVKLLDVVVKVTASVQTQALLALVVDISAALVVIIRLVLVLVVDLLDILKPLIAVVVGIIVNLKLGGLISVLKIVY